MEAVWKRYGIGGRGCGNGRRGAGPGRPVEQILAGMHAA